MNDKLYKLHLTIVLKSGKENTCGSKRKFATEELANKAAKEHNSWRKREHDVSAYPCCFCNRWHLGKTIPEYVIKKITKGR